MTVPFIPTQRVVCIRERLHWRVVADYPRRGVVYTVAATCSGVDPSGTVGPAPCVLLAEVASDPFTRAGRTGPPVWEIDCFVAVDESRLDVFRRMLVETPQPWGRP